MRLALLADIHGNLPALEAVLRDAGEVDRLIVAGDLTGGVADNAVVDRLRTADALAIRGNGEGYLLAFAEGTAPSFRLTSLQWAPLRWSFQKIDPAVLDYLASLPEQRVVALDDTDPFRVVHGSPLGIDDGIYPDQEPEKLDRLLPLVEEPVLVCGHTHRPWVHQRHGQLALNPGSVGFPCHGDPRAHYALLTWSAGGWQVEHRAVDYDLKALRALFMDTGFLQAGGGFARAFLLCAETGHPVALDLVHHARDVATAAGLQDCPALPDDLWEKAVATFDWKCWEERRKE